MFKRIFCCSGPAPTEKYKIIDHKGKETIKVIPAKATKTLGRFARGSIARIQAKKIRVEKAEQIASK
tara:strand:+ start:57 stop:257 length:201 start_codon:yes stop_codon:yes gene_type:complete